jgi:CheY-like chemotaxis protein
VKQTAQLAFARCDLRNLATDAVALTAGTLAGRAQSLDVSGSTEPLPVHGDAARLLRTLVRIIERASAAAPREARIGLVLTRDGAHATLRVVTGDAARADGPPAPHGARAEGFSGAPLPFVARVVALHAGTLAIDGGADATIALPLAAGQRVLVVDDNHDTVDVLCAMLAAEGHVTRAVYCAADVLPAAREFAPDTVLLDIGLPDDDGVAVARALRSRDEFARTRIYTASGYARPVDQERALAAGVDLHLIKPIALDQLRALLRRPVRQA